MSTPEWLLSKGIIGIREEYLKPRYYLRGVVVKKFD